MTTGTTAEAGGTGRPAGPGAGRPPVGDLHDFQVADWLVQPTLGRVTRDKTVVRVRPQLMDVLVCLSARPGCTFTKDELFARVWTDRFVAESGLARCVAELRQMLGDDARQPTIIETIPKRGYRMVASVRVAPQPVDRADEAPAATGASAGAVAAPCPPGEEEARAPMSGAGLAAPRARAPRWPFLRGVFLGLAGLAVVGSGLGELALPGGRVPAAQAVRSHLLVAFSNSTGDAAFDQALPMALAVQLEEDPALRVMSAEQVARLLGPGWDGAGEAAGTAGLAEACRRTGAVASLKGSLLPLGGRYVVGLEATSCATGEALITQMVSVEAKEQVLPGMRTMAAAVRERLSAALAPSAGLHGLETANAAPDLPALGPSPDNRAAPKQHD